MSIARGTFSIRCNTPNCNHQYNYAGASAGFSVEENHTRAQGDEITHVWGNEIICDNCNNPISFNYEVYEYPAGVLNDKNIDIEGATVVSDFTFQLMSE